MIHFTHQCTGDLGIAVEDRVVALWFTNSYMGVTSKWGVYDLVAGGPGTPYYNEAEALNAMLAIAQREARAVGRRTAVMEGA